MEVVEGSSGFAVHGGVYEGFGVRGFVRLG